CHEALGIDRLIGLEGSRRLVERGDLAVHDIDRAGLVPLRCGIDDASIDDREIHALEGLPSIPITAILTAMPKVTCGMITLCGPSATGESISTPRFMGPGCITIASGLASASFAAVRP